MKVSCHRHRSQRIFQNSLLAIITLIGILLVSACSLKFQPLPKSTTAGSEASAGEKDPRLVYRFFDEDFVSGGYGYTYPDASKIYIPEESGHNSEVALQFDLDANDFSGGSVSLYNLVYDMTPIHSGGALQFWVKGMRGGEIAWAALVDDETRDGKKTVVRLPINDFGGIKKEWTLVSIPLSAFGKRGVYWDPKKRVEVPHPFDWNMVSEFRLEIKKGENPDFRVWVDDIFVLRDVFDSAPQKDIEYWDDREETVPGPVTEKPVVKTLKTIFSDALPAGAFTYLYGGKTAAKIQPSTGSENAGVLALYLDNEDYSGVTLALGPSGNLDLSSLRKTNAGLAFWLKAAPGTNKIDVGLLDDESDGKKVQSRALLGDFGQVDTSWNYFMIPLKAFPDKGRYWDAEKQAEIISDMAWKAINEVRFSTAKFDNKAQPATIYVKDITLIEDIPGYVDKAEYWAAFKSDQPDVLLHDIESAKDQIWLTGHGPKSEVTAKVVPSNDPKYGKQSLSITYRLGDWCDVMFNYKQQNSPVTQRDWNKHWGLRFSIYTEKFYQGITVQISDSGDELFVSNTGGTKGWTEVLVPFESFNKFPYYQPPEAVQNGRFDLDNVVQIDFKPSGEGTNGTFLIDNVYLTNKREIERAPVPPKKEIIFTAKPNQTISEKINEGIFGINAALWDGDLLKPETEAYVKAVNHKVLRYPGGLRADDDNWQEVLAKKDFMVDTDEFLEFAKKTGNTAMITVNFGKGTPQQAAEWVEHVNVKRKAGVRYWEVGNELYGDWHPNVTTGDDYGKRTAEFIKAMKAVDPDILVGVVWVLDGKWNEEVFAHTKDLADAVIVHHYPQHTGQENDAALLAAPQTLDYILPSVRRQIKEFGAKDRHYEIWLTEWNSVDFEPGPQTLSQVNALFVADYLGMLTRHNIEQASYWDIHNDITDQGGDYGYLSRTGAPDGDNVPRPSYFAFKLASESLRGRLVDCASDDENVTCYLSEKDGKHAMLVVNKFPATDAVVTLKIPGVAGKATMKQLREDNAKTGYAVSTITVKDGMKLTFPRYSITSIVLE